MNSITTSQLATAQAAFISDFGAFLIDEAEVGLQPYGLSDEGEILYGPLEREAEPLEPLFPTDGSSPFSSEVSALQKAIEVPLRPLMVGVGEKESDDPVPEGALAKRVSLYGHMTARKFLAEHSREGGDESIGIIRSVAKDIDVVAKSLKEGKGNYMPNVFFLNSAILFAALDDVASSRLAVNNFFEAARSLYTQKVFIGAAAMAEKAVEVATRGSSVPFSAGRLNELHTLVADSWHKSLEADPSGETYWLRLYRGMRSALHLEDKDFMGKFTRLASHMSVAEADFEKASRDFMRRGWYGAQRYPMTDQYWFSVKNVIDRAIAIWISQGLEEDMVEKAVIFSQTAEQLHAQMKVDEQY